MLNAHVHLDRSRTFADRYMAGTGHRMLKDFYVSLKKKHSMISDLHTGPAFQREDFFARADVTLAEMVDCRTARVDTTVDVTADCVGLTGLSWMREIQAAWRDRIDLRLGAYTPFGFEDACPEQWTVFATGARQADFIACLPEADDTDDYPGHIGFMAHCQRVLELAQELGKMVHVHTDQRFEATECGTERLVEAVRRYGAPRSANGEPMVWAVHMLSPSTYDDRRFFRLADEMAALGIGVISCPSAALGMRMLRPLSSPTWNCIPRILELLCRGVHVRLGSDNIADICSPSTTADLMDEAFVLSAAIRFYEPDIIGRLLCGQRLGDADLRYIRSHLDKNEAEIRKALAIARS